MSMYELVPILDLTQSIHTKISIGMHRGVKFKISRIPLIGRETRLGWRTDRKFLRNPNLNEINFHVSWLSDFIFYPKPLYKSLHQSFFYSFITILPSESGVHSIIERFSLRPSTSLLALVQSEVSSHKATSLPESPSNMSPEDTIFLPLNVWIFIDIVPSACASELKMVYVQY
jgi:hypothetical protein